mmetsp:Transcript_75606/g.133580  ORF Transcript_75606/g.133580 Transcript_75606/m.133580 type:complete len:260 (+) Transcript_75606:1442-2221(+)
MHVCHLRPGLVQLLRDGVPLRRQRGHLAALLQEAGLQAFRHLHIVGVGHIGRAQDCFHVLRPRSELRGPAGWARLHRRVQNVRGEEQRLPEFPLVPSQQLIAEPQLLVRLPQRFDGLLQKPNLFPLVPDLDFLGAGLLLQHQHTAGGRIQNIALSAKLHLGLQPGDHQVVLTDDGGDGAFEALVAPGEPLQEPFEQPQAVHERVLLGLHLVQRLVQHMPKPLLRRLRLKQKAVLLKLCQQRLADDLRAGGHGHGPAGAA